MVLAHIARDVAAGLNEGGHAIDAVVEAVRQLERDPLFNAGIGSKLQEDGAARMSASLVDGTTERFSGVINIEGIAHPIDLCRYLLDEPDRVLSGEGALQRARQLGLEICDVRTADAIRAWEDGLRGSTGTVSAVACDQAGRIAAATSTGGRGMERIGRVSDSCTVAGNYADPSAAASCTGIGEHIVDGALAVRLVERIGAGTPLDTAAAALSSQMRERGWRAGIIALDAAGRWTAVHTTVSLSWHAVAAGHDRGFLDGPA